MGIFNPFSKHAYIPDDSYDRRNDGQTFQLKKNTWSSFGFYWYLNYRSVINIINMLILLGLPFTLAFFTFIINIYCISSHSRAVGLLWHYM